MVYFAKPLCILSEDTTNEGTSNDAVGISSIPGCWTGEGQGCINYVCPGYRLQRAPQTLTSHIYYQPPSYSSFPMQIVPLVHLSGYSPH